MHSTQTDSKESLQLLYTCLFSSSVILIELKPKNSKVQVIYLNCYKASHQILHQIRGESPFLNYQDLMLQPDDLSWHMGPCLQGIMRLPTLGNKRRTKANSSEKGTALHRRGQMLAPFNCRDSFFFSLGVIKERIHEWWKCMPTCTFYLYNPQMFSFPNQSAIPGVKDGKTESYLYHMCPWGSYITLSVPCFLNGKMRVIANLQIEFSKGLRTEYISIHLNNFWHIANAHQILDLSCSTLIRQAAFLSLMSVNIEIEILEGYCGWLSLLSICVKCSRIFLLPKSFLVKTFLRQN